MQLDDLNAETRGPTTSMLHVLWHGKWIILACAVCAVLMGAYYAFRVAVPKYAAVTEMVFESSAPPIPNIEAVVTGQAPEDAVINTQLQIIRSGGLVDKLVEDMSLIEDPEFNHLLRPKPLFSRENLRNLVARGLGADVAEPAEHDLDKVKISVGAAVRAAISVTAVRNTYIFHVRVRTTDPEKSARLANRLAELYIEDQVTKKFEATEYAVNWLSERVSALEVELLQKEDEIKALRSETDLVSAEALDGLRLRAKELRERVSTAEEAISRLRASLDSQKEALASGDEQAIAAAFSDRSLRQLISSENAALFTKRAELLLANQQNALNREISQKDALSASLAQMLADIDAQNSDLLGLNQLVREAEATRVLYETFLSRLKQTTVQIGLQQADSHVLTNAVPGSLVEPRKSRILILSCLLGGIVGGAIVLLQNMMNAGFRSKEMLEAYTKIPVLGEVPVMPIRQRSGLLAFLRDNPTSAVAESMRNMRTSLVMAQQEAPKVIMYTSSEPGEGKTTLAVSHAQNLAAIGKKVLLIECDIRRRTISKYFDVNGDLGIVSVLTGQSSLEDAVILDEQTGIFILFGEKAEGSAADLLTGGNMQEMLNTARDHFDAIIIDTPPVLVVPDARLVGHCADALAYVVKWDSTAQTAVREGLAQLRAVKIPVTGLVLSQINMRRARRYGSRYGSYSSYGYSGYYDN